MTKKLHRPLPDRDTFMQAVEYCPILGYIGYVGGGPCRKSDGYKVVSIDGESYLGHRVAWKIYYGEDPQGSIDHINGHPSDNRISNLRVATSQENSKNRKLPKSNRTGHMGVFWRADRGKWVSYISHDHKSIHLGCFDSKEEAIVARKEAEEKYGFHENHGSR